MRFSFILKNRPMVKKPSSDARVNQKRVGCCFGGSVAHLRTEPQSSGQMSLGFFALLALATLHGTPWHGMAILVGGQWRGAGMGGV
nr:hypothetical protein [Rhodoferax sp.]